MAEAGTADSTTTAPGQTSPGLAPDLRDRMALALDVDDLVEANRLARQLRPWFGVAKVGLELFTAAGPDAINAMLDLGYDVFLDDAEVIEVGRLRLHAIHNPGHTPGSISFAVEGRPLLFTGDTLFPGGPGAATFEGGDFTTIIESIDSRLFVFPAHTIVLPGHGVDTTIGAERPHLQEWIDRGW